MARNTKTPAVDAASKSDPAAGADASVESGTTTGPADGVAAKSEINKPKDDGVEDAIVVSEGPASPTGAKGGASTGEGSSKTPKAGSVDKPEDGAKTSGPATRPATDPAKAAGAVPDPGKSAPAAARQTIGPGKDEAGPDPRLGRSDPGKDTVSEARKPAGGDSVPPPASPKGTERRGPGFVPLLLGGLVAGAIGYAIPTYIAPPAVPEIDMSRIEALEADLAALEERRTGDVEGLEALRGDQSSLAEELGDVSSRVAMLEASLPEVETDGAAGPADAASTAGTGADMPASPPDLAAASDLAALSGRVDEVESRVDNVEGTTEDLSGQVGDLAGRTDGLDGDVADVSARVDDLGGEVETLRSEFGTRIDSVETDLGAVTERASSVEDEAQRLAREAARNQIRAALQSGAPFGEPLAVLGGDAPEALSEPAETGVATQAELIADFPALAREALRTGRAAEPESGVGSLFRNAFGARSLEPREGDDPDAILSRSEAALRAGDLDTALAEVETLPAAARDVLAEWIARARTRVAAGAAADEFLKDG